ncbi:hypothetical protein CMO91_01870 [Candidatus Woesearchaeota archaeon]|nr:hypothetical protein [Candidatus Woesearchaeota archaeon]|tara:strand:- start:354 stop:680 length:327 start_codon:yes stop_codon:yes gene_type:complete
MTEISAEVMERLRGYRTALEMQLAQDQEEHDTDQQRPGSPTRMFLPYQTAEVNQSVEDDDKRNQKREESRRSSYLVLVNRISICKWALAQFDDAFPELSEELAVSEQG